MSETPGGYEVPPKPETKTRTQYYVRFVDGHTEVYVDPINVETKDYQTFLYFQKSVVAVTMQNVLFVEMSTIEVPVKKEKTSEPA